MFVTCIKSIQPLIDYLKLVDHDDNDHLNFNNNVDLIFENGNLERVFIFFFGNKLENINYSSY